MPTSNQKSLFSNKPIWLQQPVSALVLILGLSAVCVDSYALMQTTSADAKMANATVGAATKIATAKKLITHDVYANWRSIQASVLSRDGQWAAYALIGQESDGEIVVKNLTDGREWRSPRGNTPAFSHDGKYLAFAIAPTKAELEKAKKEKKKPEDQPKPSLGMMDLASGKVESIERVKRFAFPEEGSSVLAVLLEPAKEVKAEAKPEVKKDLKKEEKLVAKIDGSDHTEGASSANGSGEELSFNDETGDQQAAPNSATNTAVGAGAAKKKEAGTELIVWDLVGNKKHSIKEVAEAVWNKNGSLLAYSLSAKEPVKPSESADKKEGAKAAEPGRSPASSEAVASSAPVAATSPAEKVEPVDVTANEGVYFFSLANAESRAIFKGAGSYKYLRFDEDGKQLAFLSNRDHLAQKKLANKAAATGTAKDKPVDVASEASVYSLFYWLDGNDSANQPNQAKLLLSADTVGMQKGWAPSEHADLSFSKDGQRLFLSTAEMPKVEPKNTPEAMKVDLWHWKDPELQSMQKVNAEKDKQKSYRAVVHLADAKFIQLATKNIPHVVINDNAQFAMGISELPYRQLMSWDSNYYDAYVVDLQNGQPKMLIEKARFMPQLSTSGKYLLNFDADKSTWFSYASTDGKKENLTGHIKTHFEDQQRDTPDVKNAFGVAGWTTDDASVVLYDQFDLWEVNLQTKAARNLTAGFGRKNKLEMRYVHVGDNRRGPERKALPDNKAWILSATHDVNSATGYYSLPPKATGALEPKALIHGDKLITGLIKAKDADTVLFTQQTFTEFPNLWSTDLSFKTPQKISDANPQQVQYNWGTQELIEYTSADGKKLKALLAKPENFDLKKKYPMMVYIYEKMSDNLHRYVAPAPAQNINVARYVSNGYIVLRPDIVYKTGYPGKSAMNTVLPAVQQVIAKGFVDAKRVGIQGHSWGAYQINYLITRTNMFRAVEAGASMANMVSGYGGIRWGAGISRAFQYEKQQSRIGGTPWDSTDKYVENSPIFSIDKVKTPYLTVHNDDDDAVPWYQAIEFFTALRRLNKEAYWFNYNGEKHGLRDRDNIKHFTVHMSEFFDHYLLDKPRPEWMDKPIPYLERGKRDVMGMFKAVEEKKQGGAN